jgi:hypothetical protein
MVEMATQTTASEERLDPSFDALWLLFEELLLQTLDRDELNRRNTSQTPQHTTRTLSSTIKPSSIKPLPASLSKMRRQRSHKLSNSVHHGGSTGTVVVVPLTAATTGFCSLSKPLMTLLLACHDRL